MTDKTGEANLEFRRNLEAATSAAGHEMRNALNGLVVNLEVVRAMAQGAGFSAEPFMSQALSQSEESVRLAEALIAMMKLIAGAIGERRVDSSSAVAGQVSMDAGAEAERIFAALKPLADRGVLFVEASGSTVILRVPEESPKLITE